MQNQVEASRNNGVFATPLSSSLNVYQVRSAIKHVKKCLRQEIS